MKYLLLILLISAFVFSAHAQNNLKAGDAAPEFSVTTIDGAKLSLTQTRGKVVLLAFWSVTCAICHAEIPKLNLLADSYKGKDILFLGATVDKAPQVTKYLKDNPFNFAIAPDSFGLMMQYGDKAKDGSLNIGYPNYYLIDQKGAIVFRGSGYDKTAEIDKRIAGLLAPAKL